jgi:hypothetical protein
MACSNNLIALYLAFYGTYAGRTGSFKRLYCIARGSGTKY